MTGMMSLMLRPAVEDGSSFRLQASELTGNGAIEIKGKCYWLEKDHRIVFNLERTISSGAQGGM